MTGETGQPEAVVTEAEAPPEGGAAKEIETPPEEQGDKAVLYEGPSFELEGHTYQMRRLNYLDHSRLAGILQAALENGKIDLPGLAIRGNPAEHLEAAVALLLGAFTYAPTPVLNFLASVIGVERPVLLDPTRFPFASLPMVLRKLAEHKDLTDFFAQIGGTVGEVGALLPSSGPSTSSEAGTNGPTETS